MRTLDTSAITNTVGMPVKGGTLVHLQAAYQEALTALANSIIGRLPDNANFYILYGCVNTGTYPVYTISAGAIYYAGEVFLVDAVTFNAGSNVAVGNLSVTQFVTNADPVLFTDNVSRSVHNIRKIAFSAGASGSGICDFANALQVPTVLVNDQQAALPASYTINFKQDKATFFASAPNSTTITFDFTNAVAGTVVRLKWTYGAGKTLTINTPAGSSIIRDSGNLAAVASANNLFYCIYLGKNELGYDEVSYTLKQY